MLKRLLRWPGRIVASRRARGLLAAALPAALLAAAGVRADMQLTQAIPLQPGWNAVYLEVDPTNSRPEEIFAAVPVDAVASFTAPAKGAQFVRNPSAGLLGVYGWSVWYAPSRPDAFLTTLRSIYGGKPYLVHATTNHTLQVTGPVALQRTTWAPDAFNLVGFLVDSPGAPTFQQFFRGSPAHNHNKIYRMVGGTWRQVLDPAAEAMRSGEAFWIYCKGRSDFTGPLQTGARSPLGMNLSSRAGDELVFRNRTDHPVSFTVEHLTDPAEPIPLSTPVLTTDAEARGMRTLSVHFDAAHFEQAFPPLETGQAIRLPLALRLQDAGPGVRHSLLKVSTDLGTIAYIPVTATRDDL